VARARVCSGQCTEQGGAVENSPRWCNDEEAVAHGLAVGVHRQQVGAVVDGDGGRVLQHGKVGGMGEIWQK
jgi:hypothetical protein